jgi:hypothetical protein
MGEALDRETFVGMSPADQKRYFAENGFVLLPSVLDEHAVATVLSEMGAIEASREAAGDWRGAFDYQGLSYGTQYQAGYGSWPPASVERLIADPAVLAVSQGIMHHAVTRAQACVPPAAAGSALASAAADRCC